MLLRNLEPAKGLCNGTRLIFKSFSRYVIQAQIAMGDYIGNQVLIPRIALISSDSGLPFELKRRQFPVRPAFGMSINKAQGQTFRGKVGVYLPNPVFSHGQLYVALSRVCSPESISIMAPNSPHSEQGIYIRNIVYREVFDYIEGCPLHIR